MTEQVIGLVIEVRRALGPGLLESADEECICHELHEHQVAFRRQVPLPIRYKVIALDVAYGLDLVVEERLIIELKPVERLLPIHDAQLLTYLRLSGIRVGLLLNFNVPVLRAGIRRLILRTSVSLRLCG